MKRLVLAIDCDDVLVPATEACVRIYNATYGTDVQIENAHDGHIPDWQTDRATLLRRFADLQCSAEFASIPPFDEAVQACRRLAESHELHLVTARHQDVSETTHAMLQKYFPQVFTSVEHVGLDGSKGEICGRLTADVLVDDNQHHLVDAKKYHVPYLIRFGDYRWNQSANTEEGVVHCLDWLSVEKEIEQLAKD